MYIYTYIYIYIYIYICSVPLEHATDCLRSKRGIPCNRAGVYITEYNFRMFVANDENVGDSIMKVIANTHEPIFK